MEAINKLENNDILVDTAHLSRRSFWRLVKHTKLAIYNSHANIYSLCRNKRNLTNKQIQAIVDSGGYLGITLNRDFVLSRTKQKINGFTAKDIALQFDYLIKNFGYHNFGFGTDFYGIDETKLPIDIRTYSDLKLVATELKKLGYSNKVIKHIFYKNFENFTKNIKKLKKYSKIKINSN